MLFSEPVIPVFHEMSWLEFVPYRRLLSLCVLSLTLTNLQLYLDASLALLLAMFLHRTFSVKLQYLPSREFPEIHVCLRTAVSLLKTWCELILDRGKSPLSSLFLDSRCWPVLTKRSSQKTCCCLWICLDKASTATPAGMLCGPEDS